MTQPMTADEVIDLLSAMVAYDNRNPGAANVAAWKESATRGRWTLDEALDALHEHYAASPDFVMPGHLTLRIKQARRDAHEREVAERYVRPVAALPVGVDVPGRRMDPDLAAVHVEFNARPCDQCQAQAGDRCTDPTGRLTRIPHFPRLNRRNPA